MSDLDDRIEAIEEELKDDRERSDKLKKETDRAEPDNKPGRFNPDHARDGGVI